MEGDDLADLFGLEMAGQDSAPEKEDRKGQGKAREKPGPVLKTGTKVPTKGMVKDTPIKKARKASPARQSATSRSLRASKSKPRTEDGTGVAAKDAARKTATMNAPRTTSGSRKTVQTKVSSKRSGTIT